MLIPGPKFHLGDEHSGDSVTPRFRTPHAGEERTGRLGRSVRGNAVPAANPLDSGCRPMPGRAPRPAAGKSHRPFQGRRGPAERPAAPVLGANAAEALYGAGRIGGDLHAENRQPGWVGGERAN